MKLWVIALVLLLVWLSNHYRKRYLYLESEVVRLQRTCGGNPSKPWEGPTLHGVTQTATHLLEKALAMVTPAST
jgi:hypothetical protein